MIALRENVQGTGGGVLPPPKSKSANAPKVEVAPPPKLISTIVKLVQFRVLVAKVLLVVEIVSVTLLPVLV